MWMTNNDGNTRTDILSLESINESNWSLFSRNLVRLRAPFIESAGFSDRNLCVSVHSVDISAESPGIKRKPPVEVLATIERLDEVTGNGVAVFSLNDKTRAIRVPWTVPGQTVKIRLPSRLRRGEASLREVIDNVPPLATPICSHFTTCGGCKWQHIPSHQQLEFKQRIVSRAFAESKVDVSSSTIKAIVQSPSQYEYRNRCDFSLSTQRWRQFDDEPARVSLAVPSDSPFSHDSEGVTIGFHPASGPRAAIGKVMHVASCALMDSTMNRFLHVLQRVSRDCKDLASVLKEISIRKGDRGYMVNFRTAAPFEESEAVCVLPTQYLDVVLTELPIESECTNSELSIVLSHHRTSIPNSVSKHIKALFPNDPLIQRRKLAEYRRGCVAVLHGPATLDVTLAGTRFAVSPNAFFQTNTAAANLLVSHVISSATQGMTDSELQAATLIDLFCGSGTMSLPLSRRFGAVRGFDIDDAAIEQANETASRNAAMNAKYSCHDLDLQPDELVQALSINPGDVVIVDPPRAGLHAKAVTMLANLGAYRRLVYVSCNPATQARDVALLLAKSPLRLESIQPVDMFPQTPHVESIVVLDRP